MSIGNENQSKDNVASEPNFKGRTASRRQRRSLYIFIVIVVVLLGVAGIWKTQSRAEQAPRADRYQAVFLDNGQVFFGKLTGIGQEYVTVEEAYYRQAQELPETATEEQKAAVKNNVSLAKVGAEVYGPEAEVKIRSEQVLFWQNLKPDSKVTKAIESAKE